MQAISDRCPNCFGTLRLVPGTNKLECESCGSLFALPEGSKRSAGVEVRALKSVDPARVVDLLREFAEANGSTSEKRDFVCGDSLRARRGRKKLKNARAYFLIGDEVADDEVRVLLDTTLMGSGKVGFACCDKGWYCHDELDDVRHLSWEELAAERIYRDGPNIFVGQDKFIVKGKDARQLLDLLQSIQALYVG